LVELFQNYQLLAGQMSKMNIGAILGNGGAHEAPEQKKFNSSYKGRAKLSELQLAAKSAAFVSRKVGETAKPAPIILFDENLKAKGKENVKPNPSLDSSLHCVFKPSDDFSDVVVEPIVFESAGSSGARALIGGQDVTNDERYKTNAKMQMNGENMPKRQHKGLKKVEKVVHKGEAAPGMQTISPITNLKMGDYGTWVEDAVKDRQQAEANAREEQIMKEEAEIEASAEDPTLRKLKKTLSSRGASGLAGLARRFRLMDEDNTGDVSLTEFKKALRECKMGVADKEVQDLFNAFDEDNSGSITYNEFISHLAGQLNLRRRKMVDLAFKVLDKDGNGIIEFADIAAAYDVSKHPAFLSGDRTKESILLEFLDGFDVGGERDHKVTVQEFRNYYRTISAAIESDDYFELMIRNAWHISGGEGLAANSANIRVLVTHSDGTQSVVGLLNDIGVNPANKKEVLLRLRKQGVDVIAIPGYTDKTGNPTALAAAAQKDGGIDNSSSKLATRSKKGGNTVQSLREQVAQSSKSKKHGAHALSAEGLPLLNALREALKKRGANGFNGLQRSFRIMDDDGSRFLDRNEFKNAMHDMNILLSDAQIAELFDFFDADGSNTISYDEFIGGLTGEMTERRKKLVMMAFNVLDKDGNGVVEPSDIAAAYDASRHPGVLSGATTAAAVLREFLDTFDVGGEVDGKVTKEEFVNYYSNISASIDNEDYFELMIRNAWHISGGQGQAANSANRRVLVTHADGSTSVQEIKQDLGIAADDKVAMIARLKAQGINAANIELFGGVEDEDSNKAAAKPPLKGAPSARRAPPARRNIDQAATNTANTDVFNKANAVFNNSAVAIIAKVKKDLKSRGARGFVGLQRRFRLMDRDGNKSLSFDELKFGFRDMRIKISDEEIRQLVGAVDSDGSGKIEFEEFLQMLRDPLTPRRLALVDMAFSSLDADGNGIIDVVEVAKMYNASKHPEVLTGSKSAEEILHEFLDNFDVGGEVDGKVTKEEFVNYYSNISASIDNEDYFELMIRNAWHISGGQGQAANSANRRVLVTDSSGKQSVQEIKKDLGLRQDDKAGIVARLRAQGINAADIDTAGAVDDDDNNARAKVSKPILSSGNIYKQGASQSAVRRLSESNQSANQVEENVFAYQQGPLGGGDEALPSTLKESSTTVDQEVFALRNKALKQFNAQEYSAAEKTFELVKVLLQQIYPNHMHPEIQKVIKSMQLCNRKASGVVKAVNRGNSHLAMKEKRVQLVDQAFSLLDKDCNGIVDLEEMKLVYNTTCHPQVISGYKTKDQAIQELLDVFDVGGEVDGKVTKEEFVNYYAKLSQTIVDDSYFELLIRNAWHISGGQGQAANSANRRVLVTDSSGKQSVQEIKKDLGLRQDDKAGIVARLRAQGVNAADIDTTGATKQKGDNKPPRATPELMKEVNEEVSELRKEAFKLYASHKYAEAEQLFNMIKTLLQVHSSKMHPEVFQNQKSIDMCRQKMGL